MDEDYPAEGTAEGDALTVHGPSNYGLSTFHSQQGAGIPGGVLHQMQPKDSTQKGHMLLEANEDGAEGRAETVLPLVQKGRSQPQAGTSGTPAGKLHSCRLTARC